MPDSVGKGIRRLFSSPGLGFVCLGVLLPVLGAVIPTSRGWAGDALADDTKTRTVSESSVVLTAEDGVKLEARLAQPAGWAPQAGLAVLCHPHPQYGGTLDDPLVLTVSKALNAQALATLRFNFRGVGQSGGKYGKGLAEPLDVLAATTYALERLEVPARRLAVVGYSFGAGMAAAALKRLPAPVAYVGIALPLPLKKPQEDWTGLYVASRSVLLVAGARDDIAPPGSLVELAAIRPGNTRIEIIARASHFFDVSGQRQAVAAAVIDFLEDIWRAEVR